MDEKSRVPIGLLRLAAFGLWLPMVGVWVFGVVISVVGGSGSTSSADGGLLFPLLGVVFGTVGLLLALRVADNWMGWVFLAGGTLFAVYTTANLYFYWGVVHDWPLVWVASWLNFAVYMPAILALIALPLLLFPTGIVPSPRWRWVLWAVFLFGSLSVVFSTVRSEFDAELGSRLPSEISSSYQVEMVEGELSVIVENPIGIDGLDPSAPLFFVVLSLILLAVSFIGPPAAMVSRFRRSEGTVRQQIKWLAFSASGAAVGLGSFYAIQAFSPDSVVLDVLLGVGLLGVLGIPISAGVAVSRYRLYDIDRIISRTVGYVLLIAALGVVYTAGAVWLPNQVLGEQSPIFVAASTLTVAALFNPVRRRVLTWIDRRFYRSKYDTQTVIDQFAGSLRNVSDVDQITKDSIATITQTMRPATIGAWIREPPPRP